MFYETRAALSVAVPDAEITEALCEAISEYERAGRDLAFVIDKLQKAYSEGEPYTLVDDEGRVYRWGLPNGTTTNVSEGWEEEKWRMMPMPSSGGTCNSVREQNNAAAAQQDRRLLERLVILYTRRIVLDIRERACSASELALLRAAPGRGRGRGLAGLASRPDAFYARRLEALEAQMERLLAQWREICALMPPIRNVSLRDTLASIGQVKSMYDMRFAAHEVPCDIQYQASR